MSMSFNIIQIIETLVQLTMIIMVGIYFIFSNTIMTSLKNAELGADTMVEINKVILNPLFMLCFFVSGIGSAYLAIFAQSLLALSGGVFFVGTTLVTVLKNVPLNNRLRDTATQLERTQVWQIYLHKWVFWNHIRSVSAILAALLLLL